MSMSWKEAWSYRCKTKSAAKLKKHLKKAAHKKARKGDGIVRLDPRSVI